MPIYLAERHLPRMTREQVVARQQAVLDKISHYAAGGSPVHYVHSTFVPEEARCFCLFEASNAKAVQEVNEAAEFPFARIIEALEMDTRSPGSQKRREGKD